MHGILLPSSPFRSQNLCAQPDLASPRVPQAVVEGCCLRARGRVYLVGALWFVIHLGSGARFHGLEPAEADGILRATNFTDIRPKQKTPHRKRRAEDYMAPVTSSVFERVGAKFNEEN